MVCIAFLGAIAGLALGCGTFDDSKCDVIAPALYSGSDEPGEVALSAGQQRAIVAIEDDAGALLCTGTLVQVNATFAVVTAARCVVKEQVHVRFDSGQVLPAALRARSEGVAALTLTPGSGPNGVTSIPLWHAGIASSWTGRSAMLAGFGVTETQALGKLQFVDEPITAVHARTIEVDGMGSRGACAGDLGGPLLVGTSATDPTPKMAGVLIEVSASCTGVDVYERGDRIAAWLPLAFSIDGPISPIPTGC